MRPTYVLSSLLALSASVAALAPPISDTVGQGTAHIVELIHPANRLLGPTASVFIGPLNGSPSQCGTTILETDLSVLISPDVFEGGARCGDDVTVTLGGRSVALKVAGECVCIASSIEMTEAAFTALGAQISRPVTVNWVFD
ncbi:hypothetical protein DFH08DRAFT_955594 [Mycena albidolilacea]|uniref:Uncharacterized protein n=1 Tax=Mycena albidolilacea TaxID=1033008 RepID=A0AAD7ABG8_9AGAR|nr:hypothetical protein DFH08DRAFT_955594 [Mycena albidolilacea]